MKTVVTLVLVLSVITGCATQGVVARGVGSEAPSLTGTAADPFPPMAAPSQDQNMMPRVVIPVTGGAPVVGIPVGGGLYVPVTGGAPIPGILTGP